MAKDVELFEVGPRDGLQNETNLISTASKIDLINTLSLAGFKRIEVASFVNPKLVPQMADGESVLAGIFKIQRVSYAGLTPNMRGFQRAISANCDEIAVFCSASEGFSHANTNCSINESFDRIRPVIRAAIAQKVKVRGYISCVTDCPYDGPTPSKQVVLLAMLLLELGCYEVSLGDTIGAATPDSVSVLLTAFENQIPMSKLAGHFHDTDGRALENIETCLKFGISVFDSAIGGLGGCPFAPGSPGNVATELVHDRLTALGYDTSLNRDILTNAAIKAKAISQPK